MENLRLTAVFGVVTIAAYVFLLCVEGLISVLVQSIALLKNSAVTGMVDFSERLIHRDCSFINTNTRPLPLDVRLTQSGNIWRLRCFPNIKKR